MTQPTLRPCRAPRLPNIPLSPRHYAHGFPSARVVCLAWFVLLVASCANIDSGRDPGAAAHSEAALSAPAASRGKYFGTAVVHGALFESPQSALSARYRQVASAQFNLVVPESELKMTSLWKAEKVIDFRKADEIAEWASAEGLKMRAHTLVWYRSLPEWLAAGYREGTYSADEVADLVQWYIESVMTHFREAYPGLIVAWDAVNEAIGPNDPRTAGPFGLRPAGTDWEVDNEDFWRLTLGDDYVARVFEWAHEADPEARLFYNDYHAEYENPKGEAIYTFVTGLKNQGVPIDGIGLQSHFSLTYLEQTFPGITFSVDAISAAVDRWIAAGLEVHVTEADIGMARGEEAEHAAFYADLLRATLLKSGVTAFVTWGFTDLVTWRPGESPLYFDEDIEPKPAYYSMLGVLESWNGD